jgi:hypothetical protein
MKLFCSSDEGHAEMPARAVTVRADGSSDSYDEYRGALLARAATTDSGRARTRIDQIVGQRAATMPAAVDSGPARPVSPPGAASDRLPATREVP